MGDSWPEGVTEQTVVESVEQLLRTEDWDTLTVKVVIKKVEAMLLPEGYEPGTLLPHKKFVKGQIDSIMQRMLEEKDNGAAAEAEPEKAEPEKVEPEAEVEKEAAPEPVPKKQKLKASKETKEKEQKEVKEKDKEKEAKEETQEVKKELPKPPKKMEKEKMEAKQEKEEVEVEVDAPKEEAAAKPETEAKAAPKRKLAVEDAEDDEDIDVDDDAPRFVGKSSKTADGKIYYQKFTKWGTEYSVGQDVYLEPPDNDSLPYVARLQHIFAYSFANDEVYFIARWWYRQSDIIDYGYKSSLTSGASELFFSLHMDENHADCILRPCHVQLLKQVPEEDHLLAQHEYECHRAYDNKKVYDVTTPDEITQKRVRDAVKEESHRSPVPMQRTSSMETNAFKKPKFSPSPSLDLPTLSKSASGGGKASCEDLKQIWLGRKKLEIWLSSDLFKKVVMNSIVRCSQRLSSGTLAFYIGQVVDVKRVAKPYKLGKQVTELALQIKMGNGNIRLHGMDCLSNEPFNQNEYDRFKSTIPIEVVRKKMKTLKQAMEQEHELFEEEEVRRVQEEAEKVKAKIQEQQKAEERAAEEQARKEREREEVRQWQARKEGENEQWWLKYQQKGGGKDREIGKWKARLKRFQKIAQSSEQPGERENAEKLAQQAQDKIDALQAGQE